MDDNDILTESETGSGENVIPTVQDPVDPMLAALKVDLGIRSDAYDDRLAARIEAARQRIGDLGVTLADTTEDNDLVLMYAGWLWRNRGTGEAMPMMLRSTLYNRLFGEKARTP